MKIGILFNNGSEYRQFWTSGLIAELKENGHDVVVICNENRRKLAEHWFSSEEVIYFGAANESWPVRISLLMLELYRDFLMGFSYVERKTTFRRTCLRSLSRLFLQSSFMQRLLCELISKRAGCCYNSVMSDLKLDRFIVNTPGSCIALLSAAKCSGAKPVLILHTFKDLTSVSLYEKFFDRIAVWDEYMLTWLKNCGVQCSTAATGNLQLFPGLADGRVIEGSGNFVQNRFLYIASAPWVVKGEVEIIRHIRSVLPRDAEIVVRTNPMDHSEYWDHQAKQFNWLQIEKPIWEWDSRLNVNMATEGDTRVLYDLIAGSDAVIGYPSTVILEAAALGKKYINLLFKIKGMCLLNDPVKQWESAGFGYLRRMGNVVDIRSERTFSEWIRSPLDECGIPNNTLKLGRPAVLEMVAFISNKKNSS